MTLHIEDIEADLRRGDVDGIEEAFRALIGWPGEASIVGSSAERRKDLLGSVIRTLECMDDRRTMPGDTFNLILDEAEDMDGSTYADGARAVRRCPAFFDNLDREGR